MNAAAEETALKKVLDEVLDGRVVSHAPNIDILEGSLELAQWKMP